MKIHSSSSSAKFLIMMMKDKSTKKTEVRPLLPAQLPSKPDVPQPP